MPSYKVTDPQTGRSLKLTGDRPPTSQTIQKAFGTKPTTQTYTSTIDQIKPPEKGYWSQVGQNLLPSAVESVRDISSLVTSPIQTAKGLGGLAVGTVQKLVPGRQAQEIYPEAVADYYKQRYGGWENIKQSFKTDPVGVAMDVASVVSGGAGLLQKGAKAAKLSNIAKTAGNVERVATALDPSVAAVRGITKAGGKVLSPITKLAKYKAENLPVAGFGNPQTQAKLARKYGQTVPQFMEKYNAFNRTPEEAKALIESIGKQYDIKAFKSPEELSVPQIAKAFNDRIAKLSETQGGEIAESTVKKIDELKKRRDSFLRSVTQTGEETIPMIDNSLPQDLAQEARKYKSAEEFVKAQGKPIYHGTAAKFEMFDPKYLGYSTGAGSAKGAFWFTDDQATAKAYAVYAAEDAPVQRVLKEAEQVMKLAQKTGEEKYWDLYNDLIIKSEDLSTYENTYQRRQEMANVKEAYVKGDFLEVDAKGKTPQELSSDEDIDSWLNQKVQQAKKEGKAGLKIINIDDAVGLYDRPSTHYAVFSASQIKTKSQLIDIYNQAKATSQKPTSVFTRRTPLKTTVSDTAKFRKNVIDPDVPMSEFGLSQKDLSKVSGVKEARNILKDEMNRVVPELKQLGLDYGMAKEYAKLVEGYASRVNNRQLINFSKLGGGLAGGLVAGIPGAVTGFLLEQFVNSPFFLKHASKGLKQFMSIKLPKFKEGSTASRVAGTLSRNKRDILRGSRLLTEPFREDIFSR